MGVAVYKFGGASVRNAEGVKQVLNIVAENTDDALVVVVSAMGKTTNALEQVVDAVFAGRNEEALGKFQEILAVHAQIASALQVPIWATLRDEMEQTFRALIDQDHHPSYDALYDAVVSLGEWMSTQIIHSYFVAQGQSCAFWDARKLICTNSDFRNGAVHWKETVARISSSWAQENTKLILTQGFISGNGFGRTTTLGREGSDFSGAIFAYALDATTYTIWKDVEGLMTADPKLFPHAKKMDRLDYHEAIELAYYGASVIHPKTLSPLQQKNIPLAVKPFGDGKALGTEISNRNMPLSFHEESTIVKDKQVLLTLRPKDFSILSDETIAQVLLALKECGLKSNLMEMSALSFSVCMDNDARRIKAFIARMQDAFEVRYNDDATLLTIRHLHDKERLHRLLTGKKVLVEQRNRTTGRWVYVHENK